MAVKRIKYKPLGASIQSIGRVQSTDLDQSIRGYQSLDSRINSLSKNIYQDIAYETELKAQQDAGGYQPFSYDSEGNISFNDAPKTGSSVYDRTFYKYAQETAKYKLKSYVDKELMGSYYQNQFNLPSYIQRKTDIKDGIMNSLREKNPALLGYFDLDIESSSATHEAKIFSNQRARTKDVKETTLANMRDSFALEYYINSADTDAGAKRLGLFVNETYQSFTSAGPSSEYIAGNVVFDKDDTRLNLFTAKEINSELITFRKKLQTHYLTKKISETGNPVNRAKLISTIQDGSFETVDFLNPESLANGKTLISTKKLPLGQLLSSEERMKLADDVQKILLDQKNRISTYNETLMKSMEYEARTEVTGVLRNFMNRQTDGNFDRATFGIMFMDRLDEIGREYPSLKGLKVIEEAKDLINSDALPTKSDATTLASFEKQAEGGVLDTQELINSRLISLKDKHKLWTKQTQWDTGQITYQSSKLYQDALKRIRNIGGGDSIFSFGDDSKKRNERVNKLEDKLEDFTRDISAEYGATVGAKGAGTVDTRDVARYLAYLYDTDDLVATKADFDSKKATLIKFTDEEDAVKTADSAIARLSEEMARHEASGEETLFQEKLEKLTEISTNLFNKYPNLDELRKSITNKNAKRNSLVWQGNMAIVERDKKGQLLGMRNLDTDYIIDLLINDPNGFISENRKYEYLDTFGVERYQ